MTLAWPAPWPILAVGAAIVLVAGAVRGYAGFGFSAISVAGLALLVPPASIVPAVFLLEVLASLTLLRGALRDADGRWLAALALGNALCIPLGLLALAHLPETALRFAIGALLFGLVAVQRLGLELRLAPTAAIRFAVGAASGLANGLAAIGGIVVAVLLGPSQLSPAALRATLIVLFLLTDLYALAWAALLPADGAGRLVNGTTVAWALILAPTTVLGIAFGSRAFRGASAASFRRRVLDLLLVVSLLAVLRAGLDWSR